VSEHRPDFDELVGTELPEAERERLLRVHELLLEVGPPPDVARSAPVVEPRPRRRRGMALALAAALTAGAFAVGALVGDRTAGGNADFVVAMTGTPAAAEASAALTVFEIDDAGTGRWSSPCAACSGSERQPLRALAHA